MQCRFKEMRLFTEEGDVCKVVALADNPASAWGNVERGEYIYIYDKLESNVTEYHTHYTHHITYTTHTTYDAFQPTPSTNVRTQEDDSKVGAIKSLCDCTRVIPLLTARRVALIRIRVRGFIRILAPHCACNHGALQKINELQYESYGVRCQVSGVRCQVSGVR